MRKTVLLYLVLSLTMYLVMCLESLPVQLLNIFLNIQGIYLMWLLLWTGVAKTPIEEIQAAVDGAVSPEQAVKLRQCLNHIDELEKHLEEIEQEILRLSDKYQAALDLIRTVPGFDKNPMTAIQILSEIGGDMSVFPSAKHLVSWAGCCPRNDQSSKKIKSTRISRAGSYFKPVLVQVANGLLRSKKHPEITDRYKRIKARRGHKKAIIAICRMLLTAIWHILSDLKPYTAEGAFVNHVL